MADSKISALTDGSPAQTGDIVPVARGVTTRRLSIANIITLLDTLYAALSHSHSQSDITGLLAALAAKASTTHATSHQDAGSDEISIQGLSGVAADPQVPITENVQDIVGAMATDSSEIDFTYDDTAGTLTAALIAASVALTKLATISNNRILGNISGSSASPSALTGTQITTLLDAFTDSLKGLAPASGGGTSNFLRADGSWAAPSAGAFTPYGTTSIDYNTDSGERNLLSVSITGGDMSTNKMALFIIVGDIQINSGSCTLTIRLKFGSTTLYGDASAAITNDADRRQLIIIGAVVNNASASAQIGGLVGFVGTAGAGSVAGIGDFAVPATAVTLITLGSGSAAEDTSSAKTLAITSQFSVSNSAVGARARGIVILG